MLPHLSQLVLGRAVVVLGEVLHHEVRVLAVDAREQVAGPLRERPVLRQPGREEVLPYLFLDANDRARVHALVEEGVTVSAKDLPGAPRKSVEELKGV